MEKNKIGRQLSFSQAEQPSHDQKSLIEFEDFKNISISQEKVKNNQSKQKF